MGKTWVLDTETKGTGANVVPLEKTLAKPAPKPIPRTAKPRRTDAAARPMPKREQRREVSSTPLPPGHVRKKDTGEIGRVQSVDPKAGTASVLWLKRGSASTVRLSAVSRR
jgi:hypothetical protein